MLKQKYNKYLPYLSGLMFSIIFGFSFMFTKEGLEKLTSFELLGYRFALAAISLSILKYTGLIRMNFKNKKIKYLLLLAFFQPGLYFIFETTGIQLTTSSEAGIMIALIPVVVTILGIIFLDEKPNILQIIFILLSVAGVLLIVLMKGQTAIKNNYFGMTLLAGAVIMAGFYNVLSRKLSFSFRPVEITYIMMWFGAITFNLISFIQNDFSFLNYFKPLADGDTLFTIMYLGILSSIVAFFMMNYTLSRITASQSAVFANLTTVVSIIAGVFFRNEPFYWFQVLGATMIILGVWGTNYFSRLTKH